MGMQTEGLCLSPLRLVVQMLSNQEVTTLQLSWGAGQLQLQQAFCAAATATFSFTATPYAPDMVVAVVGWKHLLHGPN
eukprot:CAMPEP_0168401686 /NCGR_PEP_ID=MMETSP0228-20121227/23236_1 /TAXON_ID=133427 /ORGANISM="Protoceratium reticulatum, Strain CCCM 535 (=CCMP 1889)" /LENGTH=77 /DNA_ID=CAMNT_0008415255 /DNA_START=76 /DNA_END=310 /DNA_ORIENTATION=+